MDKFDSFKHQTIFSLAKNFEHGRRGFDTQVSGVRSGVESGRSSRLHASERISIGAESSADHRKK